MNSHQADRNLFLAIGCLTISALLFSVMGICIRYASHSVDNYTIVFFRNVVGLILFLPFIFKQGILQPLRNLAFQLSTLCLYQMRYVPSSLIPCALVSMVIKAVEPS